LKAQFNFCSLALSCLKFHKFKLLKDEK